MAAVSGGAIDAAASNATSTLISIPSRYICNMTINDGHFLVAIDTGSSDLWIVPPRPPYFAFNNTGTPVSISYASNTVGVSSVYFHLIKAERYALSVAFVGATEVGLAGIVNHGLSGLIGFAFDGTAPSAITATLDYQGSNATAGQPFLFNIFDQTPDTDNFIGISLSRTGDLEGSANASFTINEIDETYAAVFNSIPIPIFPPEKRRWSLPLDAVIVNGNAVPIPGSTVAKTRRGKLVALMDTGTPTATVPVDVFNAIYASIPGALFSSSQGNWIVPCNTTSIVTVVLGGQSFPIHPLDLLDATVIDGVTVCTASFQAMAGNGDFDALFGDSILRNIYSLYNFGSAIAKSPSAASSMQLLSQTDPSAAVADVLKVRMALLAIGPPEGVPASFRPLTHMYPPPTRATTDQIHKYAPVSDTLCVRSGGTSGTRTPQHIAVKLRDEEPQESVGYQDKRYSD
ncbi:aspartic peptidase domain-containing protein [Mycena epipterygia]|nr:aspartic peptidase domain-containing protein [Mycena epipterygia]